MQLAFNLGPRFEIAGLQRCAMSDKVSQILAALRQPAAQGLKLARRERVDRGFDFGDGGHGVNQAGRETMSTRAVRWAHFAGFDQR